MIAFKRLYFISFVVIHFSLGNETKAVCANCFKSNFISKSVDHLTTFRKEVHLWLCINESYFF